MEAKAVPTIMSATGNVAQPALEAKVFPTIAPTAKDIDEDESTSACAAVSKAMFR